MAEHHGPPEDRIQELLNKLSQNEMRLGETISAISQSHTALEIRVRALEIAENNRAIISAREDERDKALYSRLDKIEKKVDNLDGLDGKVSVVGKDVDTIKGNFSKASWTVISAVILAVVAFIIKGGLA